MLVEEVNAVFEGKDHLDYADVCRLTIVHAVFKETLRVWPISGIGTGRVLEVMHPNLSSVLTSTSETQKSEVKSCLREPTLLFPYTHCFATLKTGRTQMSSGNSKMRVMLG